MCGSRSVSRRARINRHGLEEKFLVVFGVLAVCSGRVSICAPEVIARSLAPVMNPSRCSAIDYLPHLARNQSMVRFNPSSN